MLQLFETPLPDQRGISDDIISTFASTASNEECARECLRIATCNSFARSGNNGKCRTFTSTVGGPLVAASALSEQSMYYKRSTCRDTATTSKPPVTTTTTTTTTAGAEATNGFHQYFGSITIVYQRTLYCTRPDWVSVQSPLYLSESKLKAMVHVRARVADGRAIAGTVLIVKVVLSLWGAVVLGSGSTVVKEGAVDTTVVMPLVSTLSSGSARGYQLAAFTGTSEVQSMFSGFASDVLQDMSVVDSVPLPALHSLGEDNTRLQPGITRSILCPTVRCLLYIYIYIYKYIYISISIYLYLYTCIFNLDIPPFATTFFLFYEVVSVIR